MSVDELVDAGNVAAELELLTRPEFTLEIAGRVLAQPGVGPEPQIVSGCLRRFGIDALLTLERTPHWAATRLDATSWLEPLAGHVHHLTSPGWDEEINRKVFAGHRQAQEHLPGFFAAHSDPQELRDALRTIYVLSKDWEGDMADLIAAGAVL